MGGGAWGRAWRALGLVLAVAGCEVEGEDNSAGGGDGDATVGFQDASAERDAVVDAAPVAEDDAAAVTVAECDDGDERPCPDAACAGGVQRCDGRRWAPCVGPEERCNGLDDDCDGAVDEDWAELGQACVVGLGVCEGGGVVVCNPDPAGDAATVCNARPGAAPTPETCNGLDDDCDGLVDVVEGEPLVEACYEGPPDTLGVGACRAGSRACDDGAFTGACVGQVLPQVETCNGVDDDCDGRVDEGPDGGALEVSCYTGPEGTVDVGICRAGVRVCVAGALTACQRETTPQVEICDGLDDDCDGEVDDVEGGCACAPGERRECYTGPAGTAGVGVCVAGHQVCAEDGRGFGPCEGQRVPGAEVCDGLDNDCDGTVDGRMEGVGAECAAGVGACRRAGVTVCDAATGGVVCDARPGEPGREVCNGLDDDCDGRVDEGLGLGEPCDAGVGLCRAQGRLVCDAEGGVVCDAVPAAPGAEVCDDADNDCDGRADEGLGLGEACVAGVGACAAEGRLVCGADGGVVCDARPGTPGAEVCDGVDDDCDGRVDEAAVDVGDRCSVGVGVCRAAGVTVCAGGRGVCDAQPGRPGREVCNDLDDDCDGRVDEGLVCQVFQSCLEALDAGFHESGVYRLSPDGRSGPFDVYCDQETDGGGWTLVGSTLDETLDDQASAYYPDLATLAPARANAGVWNGLRALPAVTFDVRFACRDAAREASAPMTVDLSFYETPWYREFTTGTDADSCFSEADGRGQDLPQPARRVNAAADVPGVVRGLPPGTFAPAGTPWRGTHLGRPTDHLEGEDACDATDDFTVDFADRGMDSNESDGTDWGEDDGVRKCGRSGLAGGQWFVFAREDRVRVGSYAVSDGPIWNTPGLVAVSCVEACAQVFGGHASHYECSTVPDRVDRRAYVSGWGESRYCEGEGVPDTFAFGIPDGLYNCGRQGCSYSAYVNDHCGAEVRNHCFRRRGEFDAVQRDLPEPVLTAGGFTPCYVAPYNDGATTLAEIRARCDGNVLVMGCRPMPSADDPAPALTVAAMGHRDEVFRNVGDGVDAVHYHNYVHWYFSHDRSWGFAPYGHLVNRNTCDTANTGPEQRLCWHTQQGTIGGGWRCGAATGLNASGAWQRVVYQRSGNLTPTPEPILR